MRYLILTSLLVLPVRLLADDHEQALLERIQRLEARLAKLEAQVAVDQAIAETQPDAAGPTTDLLALPKAFLTKRHAKLEAYGYLRLDAAYATDRMTQGNIAYWVESESNNSNDNEFNMTANQSRFGLSLTDTEVDGVTAGGNLEIDFYGGGAENKSHPRMRHAYLTLDWKAHDLQILAGQYWDVLASLHTPMLNFGGGGYAGNIGYRRPQLRVTKWVGDAEAVLAISRTIGDAGPYSLGDSGEDSGFPTLQGRLGYKLPIGQERPLDIAVSGHRGQEEYDTTDEGACEVYDTWSTVLQVSVPLGPSAELMGEYFYGENLDAFYGGIGQGVNHTTCESIDAQGGWLSLRIRPTSDLALAIGAGIDDPDNRDLNSGMRSRNQMVYSNVLYNLTPSVQVGLELSHWRTEYLDEASGEGLRLQTAFVYHF